MVAIVAFTGCILAQSGRIVSGSVVYDGDNEPLVGASVIPLGGTAGVTTDIDGNFRINVPANVNKLVVSYVGMITQEVVIPADNKVTVRLSDKENLLDEVIVVAYGTAKRSAFTGSAAVVGTKELEQHVTTNVANALVGSVAGYQMRDASGAPGAGAGSINIRGIASMSAGTDPLIIVDGSPYPANLSNIPTQDIESVTVLKDAASAALYGARGAAGVILITTKKGTEKKTRVTLDAKWGSNSRALQRYDVITDPGAYYEAYYTQMFNYAQQVGGYDVNKANEWANNTMISNLGYNVYNVPEGQFLIGTDGKLNPAATLGRTFTSKGTDFYLTPDNWFDEAYKHSLRQEYNLGISGGTERGNYYASLNYLDEDGIIDYSEFERISARFKGDFNAFKWLNFGVNAAYVHSKTTSNPNMSQSANSSNISYYTDNIAPIYPLYVREMVNGQPVIKTDAYGHEEYDYGVPGNGYYLNRAFLSTGNPLGANRYNKQYSDYDQFNGTFTADIKFTDWLSANINSNVTWGQTKYTYYNNPWYGPAVSVNGNLTKRNTTNIRTNNVQTLNFNKNFDNHNVNAMIGHEYYRATEELLEAQAQGGFSTDIFEIDAFANKTTSSSYKTTYNVEGYFLRAMYDYDNKYFAQFSYRRDASSRFAKDNRWGNFWSVGLAWIINKDFLQNQTWIDQLKLKASIGQQGNDGIGNWAYIDIYTLSPATTTTMSPTFSRIGNKDITWETTTNFNIGLEFDFFNSRLNGTIDWYYKKVTDLLFWLNIPESGGSRGYYSNIGDMHNTGVEVTLNGTVLNTRDYSWNIGLNFAHNKSIIDKLPASKKVYGGFNDSNNNIGIWYQEGKSMYNIYLPVYAGVNEQGEALYYTDSNIDMSEGQHFPATQKDGTTTNVNAAPSYALGSSLPKLYGGFNTSIRYKWFDASVNFDFSLGGKIYDAAYASYMTPDTGRGGSTFHKDYVQSWSAANPTSNVPRWQWGDQYTTARSDRFLTSASYLNFQSFTVGFTLPKLCKEISTIRLYAMGENLCFWSARKGLDPRYAYSGNSSVGPYSPIRNISGGVQVTF